MTSYDLIWILIQELLKKQSEEGESKTHKD